MTNPTVTLTVSTTIGGAVRSMNQTQSPIAAVAANGRHNRLNSAFRLKAPVVTNAPNIPTQKKVVVTVRAIATASAFAVCATMMIAGIRTAT